MLKDFFFHYSKKYDVVILESLPEDDRALDPTVKWIITWTDWKGKLISDFFLFVFLDVVFLGGELFVTNSPPIKIHLVYHENP